MSNVRRVYVEKKRSVCSKSKRTAGRNQSYLGIASVTGKHVLIRYDVEKHF